MFKKLLAVVAIVFALCGHAQAQTVALPEIPFTGICDGWITYGGAMWTNGGNTITNPARPFTSADVGATFDAQQSQVNVHTTTQPPSWTGTIVSVSSGVATMSTHSTFDAVSYDYGAVRTYHTDNRTAFQAKFDYIHAQGGGRLVVPMGVCATSGPLTVYGNTTIQGGNSAGTGIMLTNGSNSDILQASASLFGMDNSGGQGQITLRDIFLDGNAAANTGSGFGTDMGTGRGIAFYGYNWNFENVQVNNMAGDCILTEWGSTAGNPIDTTTLNAAPSSMEGSTFNLKLNYCRGWGWYFNGPHDSRVTSMVGQGLGLGGFLMASGTPGSPMGFSDYHGFNNGGPDMDLLGPNVSCNDCFMEDGVIFRQFNYHFSDSFFGGTYGMSLGAVGQTDPVYEINCANCEVRSLNNNSGSGFGDDWGGGGIAAYTGNAYTPNAAGGTAGIDTYVSNTHALKIVYGSSWPLTFSTDSGSTGHIINGGADTALVNVNGQWTFIAPLVTTKVAASGAAPGAGQLRLETVAGTTGGTCKIIAYAGTSTTPTTVIDNVGSGC